MSIMERTMKFCFKRMSKDEKAQPGDTQNNNAMPGCWCANTQLCGYCPCKKMCAGGFDGVWRPS